MHTRSTRSKAASAPVEVPAKTVEKVSNVTKKPKAAKLQNTDALVASIISSIKEDNVKEAAAASTGNSDAANGEITNRDVKKSVVKNKTNAVKAVRGLPRSGRPWKEVKQKFSTIKKSVKRRPFEKKEQLRRELKHIKELSNSIKEDKKQDNLAKKQRREENAQRRLENERKSEVVQIIKNPAKLKRMKKKALRKIEKRDLDAGNGPKVLV